MKDEERRMKEHTTVTIGDVTIQVARRAASRTSVRSIEDAIEPKVPFVPKIGETWPDQGGIYAGVMRGINNNPDYHLIVPAEDAASFAEIPWGSQGEKEPNAQCEYDGLANTRALAESKHDHPAAEAIAGLEINGHRDFYLPARRELALLYANVPELFEKAWHWSSTQYSASHAWVQDFRNGFQGYDSKDCKVRARAARRLPI